MAPEGRGGSETEGGAAGRSGAPGASGATATEGGGSGEGAGGNAAAGNAGTAGSGGTAGKPSTDGYGFEPTDAAVSQRYSWELCGAIPPLRKRAVATEFLPGSSGRLAVLHSDGTVLIHSVDAQEAPLVVVSDPVPASDSGSLAMAISQDGDRIALTSPLGVRVQRLDGGSQLSLSADSACSGHHLRFSAEGSELIAWGESALCVWRVADGALLQTLSGRFASAAVAGGRLTTSEPSSFEIKTRALGEVAFTELELVAPPGSGPVIDLYIEVSPRLDSFAGSVRSDQRIEGVVWSATGDLQRSFSMALSRPLAATASYSPNGRWLLLGEQLIDIDANEARLTTLSDLFRNHPSFKVDDSGLRLASLFEMGIELVGVEVARTSEPVNHRIIGSLPERRKDSSANDGAVLSLVVSPDGARLVTSSPTGLGHSLLWSVNANFERSTILGQLPVELPLEVDFSPDSKRVAVSGDGWGLFSAEAAGPAIASTLPPPGVDINCWFNFARFARRGTFLARGTYTSTISILDANSLTPIISLATARCNGRASFSSDDALLATSGRELYRTSDWSRVWPAQVVREPPSDIPGLPLNDDVRFTPDDQSLLVTSCESFSQQCKHELYDLSGTLVRALPELSAARAGFSREGHWVLSGSALLHLPTNELRSFEPRATQSTFAPNGDIISVLEDNTLARYCRTSPSP